MIIKSETVATARTGTNVIVYALIAYILKRITGTEVSEADTAMWVGGLVLLYPFFYRAALLLAAKYKNFGVVLFGINTPPAYTPPAPPVEGVVIVPPERDAGITTIELLGVIALALLIIILASYIF